MKNHYCRLTISYFNGNKNLRYNYLFQKCVKIHEPILEICVSFEKKCACACCWFYILLLLTKYLSRSPLFSPSSSQVAEIHLASWVVKLRARREKKKKNSGKTPRVILYSYIWYYLRFDRAYARWGEFDGNRKWASDHVVSSLRTDERNGSERPCSSSVTSFCVSLCSSLRKLLTRASSTSYSAFRKSSFFLRLAPLWRHHVDCFLRETLPPALLRNF